MLLLGIDLETTGLDVEKDYIIEMGMVLWDTELRTFVNMFSELIEEYRKPYVFSSVAGMTEDVVDKFALVIDSALPADTLRNISRMLDFLIPADYIVAHNGNAFDKLMLSALMKRHKNMLGGLEYAEFKSEGAKADFQQQVKRYDNFVLDRPWIDTMLDIEYPKDCKHRDMSYLCAYHGFINPFPHRAVTDVLSMLKILSFYDLDRVIEVAKSPSIEVTAFVTFDKKDLAKHAGFYWDTGRKSWLKVFKQAILDKTEFPFDTSVKVLGKANVI